jgi:hypothetical protein
MCRKASRHMGREARRQLIGGGTPSPLGGILGVSALFTWAWRQMVSLKYRLQKGYMQNIDMAWVMGNQRRTRALCRAILFPIGILPVYGIAWIS